jgi:hypothetical protein
MYHFTAVESRKKYENVNKTRALSDISYFSVELEVDDGEEDGGSDVLCRRGAVRQLSHVA